MHGFSHGRIYGGTGFEYNDRDDVETRQGEFLSYSPFRMSINSGLDWALAPEFTLELYGQYRKSLYPDENRLLDQDGAVIREEKRDDDRILISVRGEYRASDEVDLFAEYTLTDNDSNLAEYTYESSRLMIGVQKIF